MRNLKPLHGGDGRRLLGERGFDLKPSPTDTDPPQTRIKFSPQNPNPRHSYFRLRSSERRSTFECSLDGTDFEACKKRPDIQDLDPGRHCLRARAIDAAGNVDPTPAHRCFKVRSPD